jgi:glycosyltransferase involved in cell wall biosynthesis
MSQKISVILLLRNDGYGGNLVQRSVPSIKNFIDRYDEVVIVDWNSTDGPFLNLIKNEIDFKGKLKYVIVDQPFIDRFSLHESGFIEPIGKNIGARRASCDFILSTNPDIVAERPSDLLDENTMYTARKREFEGWERQKDVVQAALRFYEYFPSVPLSASPPFDELGAGTPTWDEGDHWSLAVACGDYQLAHRDVWGKIRGMEESMIHRAYVDSNLQKKAWASNSKISLLSLKVIHLAHNKSNASLTTTKVNDRVKYVNDFQTTENQQDWGYSSYDFEIIEL